MEKILYHKIEEDVKKIGEEEKYPTQFLVDLKDLRKVSDPTKEDEVYLVQGKPGLMITLHFSLKVSAYIDGFCYLGARAKEGYADAPFERYDLGDGRIGFWLFSITDERIKEGVIMGKGMQTYKRGKVSKAIKSEYAYDGDAELSGVVVEKSDGKQDFETFYNLGGWFRDPDYEDELVDKYKKKDGIIRKLIR